MLRYRVLGPMCDGVREERRSEERGCVPQLSTVRAESGDTRANVGHATWVQTTEK